MPSNDNKENKKSENVWMADYLSIHDRLLRAREDQAELGQILHLATRKRDIGLTSLLERALSRFENLLAAKYDFLSRPTRWQKLSRGLIRGFAVVMIITASACLKLLDVTRIGSFPNPDKNHVFPTKRYATSSKCS